MTDIQATLVTAEHGYADFDISGIQGVKRACVPHNVRRGDIFNVYCDDCVKLGVVWKGSLDRSLADIKIP